MGFFGGGGYPQYLFLQEAQPTATAQGQLWVKLSTNVLSQAYSDLTWHPVLASVPAPPVGTIMAWNKSYTNTPSLPVDNSWVECNGQTLSDGGSVYNGQTIPSLNSTNRFLRGQTTSTATGGSETHSHSLETQSRQNPTYPSGSVLTNIKVENGANNSTGSNSTLPSYYEVVWIMRVK